MFLSLLSPILQKDLFDGGNFLAYEAEPNFDPKKLEENIANSIVVVFLLTDRTLFEPAVIFAMEAVQMKEYTDLIPVLVHDASRYVIRILALIICSCFFPGGEQQAKSIQHLFAEKAISLLPGNDVSTLKTDLFWRRQKRSVFNVETSLLTRF